MKNYLEMRAEEHEPFEKWFTEYQYHGGIHSKEDFAKNLEKFFEITFNPTINRELIKVDGTKWESLDEVWDCWLDYIGDQIEAEKYYDAVDNITPYI